MSTSSVRRRWTHGAAIVAAAGALTITLSGCSAIQSLIPKGETRDTETGEITEGGTTDVFSLSVGDCLDDTTLSSAEDAETEVTSVPTVPCTEPHDFEVFANLTVPEADAYPEEQALWDQAETECTTAFETFVGLDYQSSQYDFSYYYPTSGSWDEGDRTINCLITLQGEKTTGSLSGVAS
ncbi:septum formation family protein [Microbacteriaceae bacterium VKM Ac-2855]|nr:septum formation family protein [Microbacteriaceae bacterium VKM Ac-2855]